MDLAKRFRNELRSHTLLFCLSYISHLPRSHTLHGFLYFILVKTPRHHNLNCLIDIHEFVPSLSHLCLTMALQLTPKKETCASWWNKLTQVYTVSMYVHRMCIELMQLGQSSKLKTPLTHETVLAYIGFSQQLNILQPLGPAFPEVKDKMKIWHKCFSFVSTVVSGTMELSRFLGWKRKLIF